MSNGCQTEESGLFLPEELLASACRLGDEYAWRKKELLSVAAAAEKRGLASAGWKVMFRTPDGDLELFWSSYFPGDKGEDESWSRYTLRTWEESRKSWRRLFEDDLLIDEGRRLFRLLRETETPGMLPSEALWFVLYFRRAKETEKKHGRDQSGPPLYDPMASESVTLPLS